ncbi:MAG: DNA polymerase III subunit delta' [Gammaproteobacteria bacterium]|nr:DNA polymerase III subunit delta' [Gammaproteobacteria bacterium]MDH5727758.1 DNA polymerase III subunit delta' [Gammaproteobacteria bacterium]
MSVVNSFPWQQAQWNQLSTAYSQECLPHGLLFCGSRGVGKKGFAFALAQMVLCEHSMESSQACGQCKSCQLFTAHNHPDLKLTEPDDEHKPIKVNQVREIIDFMNLMPHTSSHRVVIIDQAQQLNHNAANSLLKSLEEPPANSLLILITHRPSALLGTIRSRCRQVLFPAVETALASSWLADQVPGDVNLLLNLSHGGPLLARELAASDYLQLRQQCFEDWLGLNSNNMLSIANKWVKCGLENVFVMLDSWIMDLIRFKAANDDRLIRNQDLSSQLINLVKHLDMSKLMRLQQQLLERQSQVQQNINANLLAEDIMIRWLECKQVA